MKEREPELEGDRRQSNIEETSVIGVRLMEVRERESDIQLHDGC